MSWFLRCSCCGGPFNGGNCRCCTNVSFGDEFFRNPDPISYDETPDFSYPPPQPQTYSCELCGNDSHYGYDCPPRVPLVYEQEPCYNQNFGDNYYPQNSPSFPQQYLCCENCGGPHANFQCQPRNQNFYEPNLCYNSNSSGFDQPPQYSIDHQPQSIQEDLNQQRMNDECIKSHNDMIESRNELLKTMQSLGEITIPLNEIISLLHPSIEITTSLPILPTMEPEDSLIMGDENLSTIPEKESDEVIKSSVEDLVPIPSESEDTSDNDSECDLPFCDDSSPFDVLGGNSMTFSNPLFDVNDDFTSSNEDVLEDIKSKDSYVFNLDEPALLVTPLSDANEDECFDPGGNIDEIDADVSTDIEDGHHDSEGDIIHLESLLFNDTTHNIPPRIDLDYKDSRSHGFVHRSLELQSLACLYMGIRYPRSY
ncbi:hypothetical protein Tco_0963121 [Tanacetum coccineum]